MLRRAPEEAARSLLSSLEALRDGRGPRGAYFADVLWSLVRIHARTSDGNLLETVDGRDFKSETARLVEQARPHLPAGVAVALMEIEDAGLDMVERALALRSGFQYLLDDFPGLVGDDLVEPEALAEADEAITEKLRLDGPRLAAERPLHVPASHWWWWRTTRDAPPTPPDRGRVWTLYTGGEQRGEQRALFSVVERDYPSHEAAWAVVTEGSEALREAGVSVGLISDPYAGVRPTAPTWPEFRQRHFVEGVPLPVSRRSQPEDHREPPGWRAMQDEMERVRTVLRTELTEVLRAAFPGLDADVTVDRGPVNRTPGAYARGDQRFGVEVEVTAYDPPPPPVALDLVTRDLSRRGWQVGRPQPQPDMLMADARRDAFELSVFAREESVAILAESPLYRAPAEPGSTFVVEPRRPAT